LEIISLVLQKMVGQTRVLPIVSKECDLDIAHFMGHILYTSFGNYIVTFFRRKEEKVLTQLYPSEGARPNDLD
jgi:hypothetical protein